MQKNLNSKVICFFITIILVMSCCLIGCTAVNETKSSNSIPSTTVSATQETVVTTIAPTTASPTKATEAPTEKPTKKEEPKEEDYSNEIEESDEIDFNDNDYNYNMSNDGASYSSYEFMNAGVVEWGGWTWTYYSERILPGEGLWIPGRWTDAEGYICDENGYVCLASTSVPRYSIIETPFGRTGKVYDSGCDYGVMDVYVNW
jgi:hypothetical protein